MLERDASIWSEPHEGMEAANATKYNTLPIFWTVYPYFIVSMQNFGRITLI